MSEPQRARLSALGEMVYHDAVLGDRAMGELCRGADALIITPRIAVDILPFLDRCKFISVQGTGTDAIDIAAARRQGILVSNARDFCTDAVAEHAFALLLGVAKKLERGRPTLQAARWTRALAYATLGVRGAMLGLFGCGKIGSRMAEIAAAFGMRVQATVKSSSVARAVPVVPLETLLAESDFLALVAPATTETTGLFNRETLGRMKRGSVLINVSRAALVEPDALLDAVDRGPLAGVGLDVFHEEPPAPDDPLLRHPKILVSPHVAWGTEDALERLLDQSIANLEAFAAGKPVNVVNP